MFKTTIGAQEECVNKCHAKASGIMTQRDEPTKKDMPKTATKTTAVKPGGEDRSATAAVRAPKVVSEEQQLEESKKSKRKLMRICKRASKDWEDHGYTSKKEAFDDCLYEGGFKMMTQRDDTTKKDTPKTLSLIHI